MGPNPMHPDGFTSRYRLTTGGTISALLDAQSFTSGRKMMCKRGADFKIDPWVDC